MARDNRDFVIGFIAQRRMESVGIAGETLEEDFIILTPGVGLDKTGDTMGQQYRTPEQVVLESGCDVIIVGRGIYDSDLSALDEIRGRAESYRSAGWKAYQSRLVAS
jgi:orotidine-5'-phosphate decarboxylase